MAESMLFGPFKGDSSSWRFVTDFCKVNKVTRTDSYPSPRIDPLIDTIGDAKFVTKLDLLLRSL